MGLADRWAKYDAESGWSHPEPTRTISAAPIFDIGSAQATAKLSLGLRTSVQVDLDSITWFHLNLAPKLPLTATAKGGWLTSKKFCLEGDAELDIAHEADLNWNLIVWQAKDHWGPKEDYKWSKSGIINVCKTIGDSTNTSDSIVV